MKCSYNKTNSSKRGKRASAGILEDAITIELTREEVQRIVEKYFFTKVLESDIKITEELVADVVSTSSELTSKIMKRGK